MNLGALLPLTILAGGRAALAQRAGSNAALPKAIPLRETGPVEVVFRAPHGQPNGLAQGPNPGELWVQDRGVGRQVSLIRATDGVVIREIQAEAIGPSGLTMDDDGVMWTSDTHGVMLVAFDPNDGHTLAKYFVPGTCRMYEKVGDAPHRNNPSKLACPNRSRATGGHSPTMRAMTWVPAWDKEGRGYKPISGAARALPASSPRAICLSILVCRREQSSPFTSNHGKCRTCGPRRATVRSAYAGQIRPEPVFGAPTPIYRPCIATMARRGRFMKVLPCQQTPRFCMVANLSANICILRMTRAGFVVSGCDKRNQC